jgi:hypothetical protein
MMARAKTRAGLECQCFYTNIQCWCPIVGVKVRMFGVKARMFGVATPTFKKSFKRKFKILPSARSQVYDEPTIFLGQMLTKCLLVQVCYTTSVIRLVLLKYALFGMINFGFLESVLSLKRIDTDVFYGFQDLELRFEVKFELFCKCNTYSSIRSA